MNKFIITITTLFLSLNVAFSGYNCINPTDCSIYCSNVESYLLDSLTDTNWISVPWDDGSCYFHNTETGENINSYPLYQVN